MIKSTVQNHENYCIRCELSPADSSQKGPKRWLFDFLLQAKVGLALSSEILLEYREILTQKTNLVVADNIVKVLTELPDTKKVDPSYQWLLIKDDPDDNKYVDCAIAANAAYLISDDRHFDILKSVGFPQVSCLKLIHVKRNMF